MKTCDRGDIYPNSEENEISVFSWNLLAPTYDRSGLDWETVRLPALREWLIRFVACDVMCFQEVDVNYALADIVEILGNHGFTAVVQERKGHPVVNATFFNSSRLKVMWTQHRSRALLVNFLSMTGREVCIGNVHLEAGSGNQNESQRRTQLTSAVKRICGSPISIICGDFNSSIGTGSPIKEHLVEAGFVRAPTRGITWAMGGYGDMFDHIWVSESLAPVRILNSSSSSLSRIRVSGLPNTTHPSDHLPVAATFRFALQSRQHNHATPSLEVPQSLAADITEEWLEILRIGSFCSGKNSIREQKKLKASFLSTISEEDAVKLRDWQKVATVAAQALVRGAVQQALIGNRKTEAIFAKSRDPGKQNLSDSCKSFGGA
jgi:endonuclease/exonuclease/phosphatase family metal-dependent hydrolase